MQMVQFWRPGTRSRHDLQQGKPNGETLGKPNAILRALRPVLFSR